MSARRRAGFEWAMLLLRLALGLTFFLHGSQKVFGAFGGPGLTNFAHSQGAGGVWLLLGYAAALCEFLGGLMVLLGLAAEVGALLIVPVMLVAIAKVHLPNGFFLPKGFEYAWNLLLVALAVIVGGPGRWCLWDPFARWRDRLPVPVEQRVTPIRPMEVVG